MEKEVFDIQTYFLKLLWELEVKHIKEKADENILSYLKENK
jgi:hypothetical protein